MLCKLLVEKFGNVMSTRFEEVGDPGSVLSEEELIPTVERPTVE